jgi:hypothetical protein
MENKDFNDVIHHSIYGFDITEYQKSSIYVVHNGADEDFCNKLIDFIENSQLIDSKDEGDELIQCKYLHLDKYNDNNREIDYLSYQLVHKIFLAIIKLNPYVRITGDTIYHFRKIYGPTKLHTDDVRASDNDYFYNKVRCMSFILSLNDNYNGGEFNFPKHDIKLKLKRGSILLFPSFWTHPHEVSGIGEGETRYTFTTWGTEDVLVDI